MIGMNPAMPIKAYEALIFDCDGTLTDSMPVHYVAWHRTMQNYGIQFPEDRFYSLGGMPTDKIIRMLADEQQVEVDAHKAAIAKENAFLELLHLLAPIQHVVAVAKHFHRRVPLIVASGGFREIIKKQLSQIGCDGLFDDIVAAEDTDRHKPEPDVFLEAARRAGADPTRCLVYEDSDFGLQAARSASMDFIDVRTFHSPKRLAV